MRARRAGKGGTPAAGLRSFCFSPLGCSALFLRLTCGPPRASHFAPVTVFYTGIGLIWAGMALRLWAVMTLGQFFRTSVLVHEDHRLITSGPYRVLRHPSYTGSLITLGGIGLAMGNWLSVLIITGCALLAFAIRMMVEETALAEHFGAEFAMHKRRTWAIIPFIW